MPQTEHLDLGIWIILATLAGATLGLADVLIKYVSRITVTVITAITVTVQHCHRNSRVHFFPRLVYAVLVGGTQLAVIGDLAELADC
jgi:hypothetical protein